MAITDHVEASDEPERRRGRTTIELRQRGGGDWVATQRGVDVEGRGDSAAEAAADYCRRIVERDG